MSLALPVAIEPVRRALLILAALNGRRTTTLTLLAQTTGLPKATVGRLAETLIAIGYVTHVSRKLGYRITDRVLTLSSGIRFVDHFVDAAVAPMNAFTRKTRWPLYLGTISAGAVAIRYSTAPRSPLSFETTGYDQRFPTLASAIGRVYLAFCPDEERASILKDIEARGGLDRQRARLRDALAHDFVTIRSLGYAGTRAPQPSRLNGIAVPIPHGGHVLGGLSMRFPKSAMREDQAATRYLPLLQASAREIAARVAAGDLI